MSRPQLYAASPLTIPARVYDRIWIEQIEIMAPDPAGDATAIVRLRRYCMDDAGNAHTDPESLRLEVSDLLAKSETDSDLAQVVASLMGYIAKAGVDQGMIAPPEA